jgi:hypothetical protein
VKPVRLQLRRSKGFNLQAASLAINGLPAKIVARPTRWGNPFPFGPGRTQAEAVALAEKFIGDELKRNPGWLEPLRGHNLACWCKLGTPCHADLLVELANR